MLYVSGSSPLFLIPFVKSELLDCLVSLFHNVCFVLLSLLQPLGLARYFSFLLKLQLYPVADLHTWRHIAPCFSSTNILNLSTKTYGLLLSLISITIVLHLLFIFQNLFFFYILRWGLYIHLVCCTRLKSVVQS